jgi:hypothetical protein
LGKTEVAPLVVFKCALERSQVPETFPGPKLTAALETVLLSRDLLGEDTLTPDVRLACSSTNQIFLIPPPPCCCR